MKLNVDLSSNSKQTPLSVYCTLVHSKGCFPPHCTVLTLAESAAETIQYSTYEEARMPTSSSSSPTSPSSLSSVSLTAATTSTTEQVGGNLPPIKSIHKKKAVCGALTRRGTRCQNTIITRSGICPVHHSQRKKKSAVVVSSQPLPPPPPPPVNVPPVELTKDNNNMTKSMPTKCNQHVTDNINFIFETPELIPSLALETAAPPLPTSPLTEKEMSAGGFWNPPNLAAAAVFDDDDVELGNMLNFDETPY